MNIDIEYLGGPQVKALNLTDAEIIAAVERGLDAAGRGQTVIEPRTHLNPMQARRVTSTYFEVTLSHSIWPV